MRHALAILMLTFLAACAHAPAESHGEEDAALKALPKAEAEQRLADTHQEVETLEKQIRSAQTRYNSLSVQASSDPSRKDARDATQDELQLLQGKRASLLHRQHVLEGRMRDFGAGEE